MVFEIVLDKDISQCNIWGKKILVEADVSKKLVCKTLRWYTCAPGWFSGWWQFCRPHRRVFIRSTFFLMLLLLECSIFLLNCCCSLSSFCGFFLFPGVWFPISWPPVFHHCCCHHKIHIHIKYKICHVNHFMYIFIYFFFSRIYGIWTFLGQGSNWSYTCRPLTQLQPHQILNSLPWARDRTRASAVTTPDP